MTTKPNSHDSVPAIVVDRLSYTFPGRDVATLLDVSFAVEPGSWTVVAGPTGSGKSTLLRALVGLIPRLARGTVVGEVRLFGRPIAQQSASELARTVGFVQQSPDDQICATTVAAELAFGLENLQLSVAEIGERIAAAAVQAGLGNLLERPTPYLSGGQKQRLVLAAITAMRPRILVCDEPLARLDAASAAAFLAELRRLQQAGTTIVTAEHRLDEIVPFADRVLLLDGGRLTSDRRIVAASSASPLPMGEGGEHREPGEGPAERKTIFAMHQRRFAADPHPPFGHLLPKGEGDVAASLVLRGRGLAYRFPGGEADVWSDVNFELRRGERVAVVGPNGAGKSTLLALLAGELRPRVGELTWSNDSQAWPVVLVPQQVDLTLVESTVGRELAFGPRQCGWSTATIAERTDTAARLLRIDGLLDDLPQSLSQGQRVRTAIAAALATAPRLLLLDEPTTGQDLPTMHEIMSALGRCIGVDGGPESLLFSTHDLATAVRHADRVWVVTEGRLFADVPAAEFAAEAALQHAAQGGGPN